MVQDVMKNAFQSTPARPKNTKQRIKTEKLPEIIEEAKDFITNHDIYLSQGRRQFKFELYLFWL